MIQTIDDLKKMKNDLNTKNLRKLHIKIKQKIYFNLLLFYYERIKLKIFIFTFANNDFLEVPFIFLY
jgi:hypothetical protein